MQAEGHPLPAPPSRLRKALLAWYASAQRDLPWRRTQDPYRIWLSETMLQQTRVAAVLPYYERFLAKYPAANDLAQAPEQEVLAMWAGLGYYSRARNLHAAAKLIARDGEFPRGYEAIRALPGVGEYTAAAVASIAFGLPHAVVDGNVLRVMARLTGDPADIGSQITRRRIRDTAQRLLDRSRPGDSNQALMELGATVCMPREPLCRACPWSRWCVAHQRGLEFQLPVKLRKQKQVQIQRTVLIIARQGALLLRQRSEEDSLMPGFWELPEPDQLPDARAIRLAGSFRHSITFHNYRFDVVESEIASTPQGYDWVSRERMGAIPLSTIARKALRVFHDVRK
ncbi:MAG: A/G-specific adenine glycosylase [Bryobacteraceae bacterium]